MKPEEPEAELKQNDLMSWFQYGLPLFLKQNGSYILLVLALGLLGWSLYNRYEQKLETERQTAWNELSLISSTVENEPAKLQDIITRYDIKPVQAQAWLRIGDFYLRDVAFGTTADGYNGVRIPKNQALDKAENAYKHVIDEFSDRPLVAGSAHLGLATVAEDRGNWDDARKQYELLTDKSSPFADTAFAAVAQIKIAQLPDLAKAPRLAAMVPAPTSQPTSSVSLTQPSPESYLLPANATSAPATQK